MKRVLIDGYEYPADPPHRPRGMDDVAALRRVEANIEGARLLVGFHERSLYKMLCRMQSAVRAKREAVEESTGRSLDLTENAAKLPFES